MKQFTLLLFACFFATFTLNAQSAIKASPRTEGIFVTPMTPITGFEAYTSPDIPASNATGSSLVERQQFQTTIGETYYDLQSNSSTRRLLARHADGQISGVWTQGSNTAGWPNRGTGYNHYDGSEWGAIPTERLEADTRTGWATIVAMPDGSDRIFAHNFTDGAYGLTTLSNETGAWVQGEIPTNAPTGSLWPRAASGGPDGNTIHVISLATPTAFGADLYEGADGHIIYHRSTDAGATWDQVDVVLPNIDSLSYGYMSADTYYVDAEGETVAIGVFPTWGDLIVLKSTDNGDTWTTHRPNDFPVDGLAFEDSIATADIPLDTFAVNTLEDTRAIYTTDAAGTVMVGKDGRVHAFWGQTWVALDAGAIVNDGWTFYPGASLGIGYWNEDMGDDTHEVIGGVIDYDGDGLWTVDNDIPYTGEANVSYPTAATDADGNLFMAYTAPVEYFNENANNNGTVTTQHFRHVHMQASMDGGLTWGLGEGAPGEIYDLPNTETFETPLFISAIEGVHPSLMKNADEHIHIVYQQDFEPGDQLTGGTGDSDPLGYNEIVYVAIDQQNFGILSSDKEPIVELTSNITPNPASGATKLNYTLDEAANVTIDVFNLVGQHIKTSLNTRVQAGVNAHHIDVNDLATGVYLVHLRAGDAMATHKLIVE